ncbi:MAG: ABC transporter substrate-binding protein [Firmicutes bacterium]|nr:ABC transporter substrate-binding protein [Bacillota bacterium]
MKYYTILLVCLCLLFSSGCGERKETTLRLAYQTSIANAVAAVADKGGFLLAEGLEVESQVYNSGPMINEVLAAGHADVGIMGDVPAVLAAAGGIPIKIVATVGGGNQRHRLLVPLDSPLRNLPDLLGKQLGITLGSTAHSGYYHLMEKYNLNPQDITLVNLNPGDMPEALAARQVDAVLIWEPIPSLIESKGLGRELLTLAETDNLYPVLALITNSFAQKHPQEVEALLRGLEKAAEFIITEPEAACHIISTVTGLDPDVALKALAYHYFGVYFTEEIQQELAATAQFLLQMGTITTVPAMESFIDRSYFPPKPPGQMTN